jgi:leucyl aminopeptidase
VPELSFAQEAPTEVVADVLAVFATGDDRRARPGRDAAAVGTALGVDLAEELSGIGFEGELGKVARIPTRGSARAPLLLVVGLGKAQDVTTETLRRAAGAAARNATKDAALAVVVPGDLPAHCDAATRAEAVTEGAGLGSYAFTTYRSKPTDVPSLRQIKLLAGEGLEADDVSAGIRRGDVLVRATCLTRDLVNTPPLDKRPPALADRIATLAGEVGLSVKIHDEAALAEGGFGGILGVGQGSSEPPRLVELTYQPSSAAGSSLGHVVLVGKGITFDSGGLSLKPSASMTTMKSDMSGAAAVVGAMSALAELGVTVKVTGLLALAENMPSGEAIRVSDVLTHRGGKTVEVMNTDAEGRLVLADALAYGAESGPDAMIDIATLTGAQIVSLGYKIAGLMGNDEALIAEVRAAAETAGEQVWQLPLPDEYADHLRSEVADLKNIGKPMQAGTLIGGLYLRNFVGQTPWAHLDIAGPAFSEEGDGWYNAKGATGMGVRTLVRLLQARSS